MQQPNASPNPYTGVGKTWQRPQQKPRQDDWWKDLFAAVGGIGSGQGALSGLASKLAE